MILPLLLRQPSTIPSLLASRPWPSSSPRPPCAKHESLAREIRLHEDGYAHQSGHLLFCYHYCRRSCHDRASCFVLLCGEGGAAPCRHRREDRAQYEGYDGRREG